MAVAISPSAVMKEDSRQSSWALNDPVKSDEDIDRKFGDISYSKGGAVIRMMESFLGPATLAAGLGSYLQDLVRGALRLTLLLLLFIKAYGAATEMDLFAHLEAAGRESGMWPQPGGPEELSAAMGSWTNQAGLPVVTVERAGAGLAVSQAWYTNHAPPSTEQQWAIPVTVAELELGSNTDWDDTRPQLWLLQQTATISLSTTGPVVVNKRAVGYYRVQYSGQLWEELAQQLLQDHTAIHPLNRSAARQSGGRNAIPRVFLLQNCGALNCNVQGSDNL